LSWGSFLNFFAFKEGMLGTLISVLGGWPTVSPNFWDITVGPNLAKDDFLAK